MTLLAEARARDAALPEIRDKVLAGQRLDFDDGVALYRSPDLLAVGQLANHVREQRHGDTAYFVCNTHINHTNVCVATCDFCAFAAKPGDPRGYSMSLDAVLEKIRAAIGEAQTENLLARGGALSLDEFIDLALNSSGPGSP